MDIELPFTYRVCYKEPRQPSWRDARINGTMPLTLVEVDELDAPVLHVVHDNAEPHIMRGQSYQNAATKFRVVDGRCVVRFHDGAYYASRGKVQETLSLRGDNKFDVFAFDCTLPSGRSEHRSHVDTKYERELGKSISEFHAANPNAKKFTDERHIYEEVMMAFARDRLIVVEGVLYERVHEPVLCVAERPGEKNVHIFIEEEISPALSKYRKGMWRANPGERTRFGLDQFEKAKEYAARVAKSKSGEVVSEVELFEVDVAAVKFRGEHERLFVASAMVCDHLVTKIGDLPRELGMAVSDAATLLAVNNRLTLPALRALRRLSERMIEQYGKDGDLTQMGTIINGDWQYMDKVAYCRVLQEAFRLWDDRDSEGHEWLETSVDALPVFDYPRRAAELTSLGDFKKLTMRWHGTVPSWLKMFDPSVHRLLVVDDIEQSRPSSVFMFDRFDPSACLESAHSGHCSDPDSDHRLVMEYLSSDPKLAMSMPSPRMAS